MKILAFDTSNKAMSVAVVDGDHVLAEKTVNIRKNHSVQLMPTIDELLNQVQLNIKEINRIVVAEGPGSYTGLRIAATTAKTLSWTLNIDLVGVSSLQVLAQNVSGVEGVLISPLFDARRGNFYTGLYQLNAKGQAINVEPDTHIALQDWLTFLKGLDRPVVFVGEDAWRVKDEIEERLNEKAWFNPWIQKLPSAQQLAYIGAKKESVPPHSFVPRYLKLAEAEVNWLKRHTLSKDDVLVEKI